MTLLLDTNVLVDYLRGRPDAVDAVIARAESGGRLAAATVTKIELLAGMRPGEESSLRDLFAALDWLPLTDEVAERAGELAARFHGSHPGIEVVDYAIAATAEESGAELWTRNVRHYPMFPGLHAPY
jgi:predicted nucleic acid-binding protein